ncbi:MAG: DNA photolyase [Proteobacteria bacterium]|nr:DNA photolyase [Pseudomonadota bacterium]
MSRFRLPRSLIAETGLLETPLGRRLSERLTVAEPRPSIQPADYPGFGPDDLLLTRHRGEFVKPCPGTRGYICCGLQIIHFGLGCTLDCTYCILQGYLDTRALVLFGNLEAKLDRVGDMLDQTDSPHRYCTGEFTDSLLLEGLTGLGARLVRLFAGFPGKLLELKTKTDHIESLCGLDHGGRTVVSFSVNAPAVAAREESGAATLARRLAAASRLAESGYRLGFHFDPLIRHPGWEPGYRETVARIFEAVPAERIAWISLGAFRYLPRLKAVVARRHPRTRIMDGEFVLAGDGKMRYVRPLRVEMYRVLVKAIRKASPDACVYLCMENGRVWREVFGFDPAPDGLIRMLDQRV